MRLPTVLCGLLCLTFVLTTNGDNTTTTADETVTQSLTESTATVHNTTTTIPPTEQPTTHSTAEPTTTVTIPSPSTSAANPTTTETGTTTAEGQSTTTEINTTPEPTTTTTTTPTTTTPPTTTPEVWAEFELDCETENGICIYKLIAPQYNDAFANQSSSFSDEKNDYVLASRETYQANLNFSDSEALSNYTSLRELYFEIQDLYENLTSKVATALNNSETVKDNLDKAWDNLYKIGVGLFPNQPQSCYATKCQNIVPPTTTTTMAPTTTPLSVCANVNCTTFNNFTGNCLVINNQPTCQCPGNLDQYNNCGPVVCKPSSTIGLLPGSVPGPIWSVGYNGTNDTNANYGSNRNCYFRVFGDNQNQTLKITMKAYKLDATAILKINKRRLPSDPAVVKDYLDYWFNSHNTTSFVFEFTSGKVDGSPWFYDFYVEKKLT
uniref:CUB domain-containing protein n=1 Tax=Panagrolaimus sp. JU765 TaxID=591449 RepID=A0AC34PUI6_9BILA